MSINENLSNYHMLDINKLENDNTRYPIPNEIILPELTLNDYNSDISNISLNDYSNKDTSKNDKIDESNIIGESENSPFHDLNKSHMLILQKSKNFSNCISFYIELCNFLKAKQISLNIIDDLIKLFQKLPNPNETLYELPSFKLFFKYLEKEHSTALPLFQTIPLETNQYDKNNIELSPKVITFNFKDQLLSLLNNKMLFSNLSLLSVNKDNPWENYEKNIDYPFEIQDGNIYDKISNYNKEDNLFQIGIQLYLDKTGIDQYQKHTLEPVMFTLTLFKEELRNKSYAWKHLGFIPSLQNKSSAIHRKLKKGANIRNYHSCLSKILESFYECQRKPFWVELTIGSETRNVLIKTNIISIIGDGLSNDVLCGKIMLRTKHSMKLSRCCFTPTSLSDNSSIKCNYIQQWHIEALSMITLGAQSKYIMNSTSSNDCNERWEKYCNFVIENKKGNIQNIQKLLKDYLHKRQNICNNILQYVYNVHGHDSAFNMANFGNIKGGIMEVTGVDMLHVFENGILPEIINIIINPLSDSVKTNTDRFINNLFGGTNQRCYGRRLFPRSNFIHGFSKLTELTAEYKVGRLIALAIMLQFGKGQEILECRLDSNFDENKQIIREKLSGTRNHIIDKYYSKSIHDNCDENDSVSTKHSKASTCCPPFVDNKKNNKYLNKYLHILGLSFIKQILIELPLYERKKVKTILWEQFYTLNNNEINVNGEIKIPESFENEEWSSCCDLRTDLHSYRNDTTNKHAEIFHKYPSKTTSKCISAEKSLMFENMINLQNFLNILLGFYAFYHYGKSYYLTNEIKPNITIIQNQIMKMMDIIKTNLKRDDNTMNWKISKFHDLLHISKDMRNFGYNLMNIHTGKGECGLKMWAKHPSKLSQKHDQDKFLSQVSSRIYEESVLMKANMSIQNKTGIVHESLIDSSTYDFELKDPLFRFYPKSKSYCSIQTKNGSILTNENKNKLEFHVSLIEFLSNETSLKNKEYIDLFSVCIRKKDNLTFRCHPNYQNQGPWYDWVSTKWENDKTEYYLPGRCMIFLKDDNAVQFVCLPCNHQTKIEQRMSNSIFSHWNICHTINRKLQTVKPKYYLLDVSCINQQEWVLMENDELFWDKSKSEYSTKIVWIHNIKNGWVDYFLNY